MISHDFCRDKLGEFLDQSLDQNEREMVAAHLETCADCAQIARQLGAIRATLREFKPVAAPAKLRQNVRAALQNEQSERATRSRFAWRLPSMAWSGTLAFAALALIVLARPFANAPISLPEGASPPTTSQSAAPNASSPASNGNNAAAQKESLALKTAPRAVTKPAVSPEKRSRAAPVRPRPNAGSTAVKREKEKPNTRPAEAARADDRNMERANSTVATAPQFPRVERPSTTVSAPKPRLSPPIVSPEGAPPTPELSQNRKRPAPIFPKANSRANREATVALAPPRLRIAPPRPPEAEFGAAADAAAPATRRRIDTAPTRATAPLFSLQLKAAPLSNAFPVESAPESALVPKSPAQSSTSGAFRGEVPAADSTADSTADEAAPANSPSDSATMRAMRPPSGALSRSPSAVAAPKANAQSTLEATRSGGVRRFELRIQVSQRIENARVRLELPPNVKLLWPAANPVWSGELSTEKPVEIAISLGSGSGGEKISVTLEQKMAGAPSRILETQTLILPASP